MASKWYMMELPDLLGDGHTFKAYVNSFGIRDPRGSHGTSVGAGKVTVNTVEITRPQDKYSPMFRNVSMDGRSFSEMTLTVMTFDNGAMISRLVVNFSNLVLETYLPQNGAFGKGPIEKLTFNFETIEMGA